MADVSKDQIIARLKKPLALWQAYIVTGVAILVAYYMMPAPIHGNGVLFNLIGLSSSVAILIGVKINKPQLRHAWYLFALGQFFFVSGDSVYYSYDSIFHKNVPFPSIADFLYLAVYPALIAGLLILIRRRSPRGDRAGLIDALVLTIGLAFASWVFLMAPYAHDPSLTLLEKLVSIAYPLMDVCLFAVAVRLAVGGGRRHPALALLLCSVLSLLTADAILGVLTLHGGYNEGGLLDAGWAAYYLLWGAAALHPSMRRLGDEVPPPSRRITRSRLALLTGASLIAPAIQAAKTLGGRPVEPVIVSFTAAALFCLVMLRMAGLLRDSERTGDRERNVREASKSLVSASSLDEVYGAAIASVKSLAGKGAFVRLVMLERSGELTVRRDEDHESWHIRAADLVSLDAAALRENLALEIPLPNQTLTPSLRLPTASTHAVVFPLIVSRELRGFVFVATHARPNIDEKSALQTLTAQIALAVESASLTEDLAMRKSEARFQSLVQNSSDLITVIDRDGTVLYQSPSVRNILGYTPESMMGRSFIELVHPHDQDSVSSLLEEGVATAHPQAESFECRLRHETGGWLLFDILRTDLLHDPSVQGIVLNGRDISERKEFERQLAHQAFHDALTGLANRALFGDRVQHALARQVRTGGACALIFLDLDDFKMINDSFGHAAGDMVLKEMGSRLRITSRQADTVARFGGDEFAVLIEGIDRAEEIGEIADRMSESLNEPMVVEGKRITVHVSMGIATSNSEDAALVLSAEELMRNADTAMYIAKREGKGHRQVFEPQMHTGIVKRLELKGALEHALENGEFELFFQPVVKLPELAPYGVEALVRWNHPERGLVGPGDFITIAEETGFIIPLGNWVLEEAIRRAVDLQIDKQPPVSMSVNISLKQLRHPGFVDIVKAALKAAALDPSLLTLEITESVMMEDTEMTIERLHALKGLGLQLAIDDFGTGYSSLSYLSRFPVDVLKIDRSFVSRMDQEGSATTLAAAIVKLGQSLDLQTVAEGIELPDQLAMLNDLGCTHGQGFFVARPMPHAAIRTFLEKHSRSGLSPTT